MRVLLTRFYYAAKPWLPWRVRLPLRKLYMRVIARRSGHLWPICEEAGRRPEGWGGWPGNKPFALVLTHDVESNLGLQRVKLLAEMEMAQGFRSSFNFIPEGPYSVPPELRQWLIDRGFEVGVHDLHHDGKLYWSRQGFRRKAERINTYLKSWNAVGYRSGFMHHDLEWHHDLNILYDASTFDTDPFEPQPDGVKTIFPFWVPDSNKNMERLAGPQYAPVLSLSPNAASLPSGGYVELPYTLPQDSTLFLFLGERTIEIWKKKLEWIVSRGGMALVNVHPDYNVCSDQSAPDGIALCRYFEFLCHISSKYKNSFWNPLPKDMAISTLDQRVEPVVH